MKKEEGLPFTHNYIDRGAPQTDSKTFRKRLGHYCQELFSEPQNYLNGMGKFLIQEMGIDMPHRGYVSDFEQFFVRETINNVLNAITYIWRFATSNAKVGYPFERDDTSRLAEQWLKFVQRTLVEENLNYTIDPKGGIHFLIDEEFQRNLRSLLRCLESPMYTGTRTAFEDAKRHLESNPPDTKAAVRSAFESVEILAKKMVPGEQRLNRRLIEGKLKTLVTRSYESDPVARNTIERIFDGMAGWFDALHNYRHGQAESDPVAPPFEVAVYILSSCASFLRLLVEIDTRQSRDENP